MLTWSLYHSSKLYEICPSLIYLKINRFSLVIPKSKVEIKIEQNLTQKRRQIYENSKIK